MAGLLDDPEQMNKLMQSPLIQMGLGLLANNKGQYASQNALAGAGQGFSQSQDYAQQDQSNLLRKQQADMQKQQYDLLSKKFDQEHSDYELQNKSISNIAATYPQFADLLRIDPKAAIKAIYPTANGADPYFTPISTENGLGSFDNRKGTFTIVQGANGQPVIKAADSPKLQGTISASKSYGENLYNPTDMIDGVVVPKSNAAIMGGAPAQVGVAPSIPAYQGNTPYPMTWNGQPMGAPGTTSTGKLEGDDGIQLRDPAHPNRMSILGVQVPTKAQQAANVKTAEMNAEATTKKEITMNGIGSVIDQARGILDGNVKPTDSGLGNIVDAVGATTGFSPKGAAEADALRAVAGQLVSKMPRMEGPQSNVDVQNYKEMAGDVGNPTIPIERRKAALAAMEKIVRRYDKSSNSIMPSNEAMPQVKARPMPSKPSGLTLKKGTVYQTPKGNLTWNGKAFED